MSDHVPTTEEPTKKKGGRPSRAAKAAKDADFNAAVEAKVREVFEQLKSQMTADAPVAAQSNPGGIGEILSDLVVSLKKMADPQSQKRVFSPEEISRMESAREAMAKLLLEAHIRGEMPVYSLRRKVYLAEQKIEPQYQDPVTKRMQWQQINWPKVPNEAMVPVNDLAKRVYELFMASILGERTEHKNTMSGFVLNGSQILRGRSEEAPQMGNVTPGDIRRAASHDIEPPDLSKPIQVLGTTKAGVAVPTAVGFGR